MSQRPRTGGRSLGQPGWIAARVVSQAFEFGVWLILARRLTTDDVGTLAVAMVLVRLGGLVGDWGAVHRGAREVSVHGVDSAQVVGLVRRRERASLILLAVWVGATLPFRPELALLGLVLLARGTGRDWMALGEDRRLQSVAPPLILGSCLIGGGAFVSSSGEAVAVFASAHVIAWVVSISLNRLPSGLSARGVTVDPWYLVAGLADQVLISGDTVVLAVLHSTGSAGIYAMLYRYPAAWLTIVGLAVSVGVPAVARRAGSESLDTAAVRTAILRGSVAAVGLILLAPLAVVSVASVWGTDFVAGRTALAVLLAAAALTTISAPIRILHVAYGKDRSMAIVTVAVAIANLVGNILVVGTWGMTAAAITTLLSQAATLGYFLMWASRASRASPDGNQRAAVRATVST